MLLIQCYSSRRSRIWGQVLGLELKFKPQDLTPFTFILACALWAAVGCSGDTPAANGGGSADIPRNVFAGEPFSPNDPYFSYDPAKPLHPGQWNLGNQAPASIHYPAATAPNGHKTADVTITNVGLDANILPVWKAGYTGRGIIIGILDDGVEFGHPDLDVARELSTGMDYQGHRRGPDRASIARTPTHTAPPLRGWPPPSGATASASAAWRRMPGLRRSA